MNLNLVGTVVFNPQIEIAELKKRIEQLEMEVGHLRNRVDPFAYGWDKWCPPAAIGGPYWLNAPQVQQCAAH